MLRVEPCWCSMEFRNRIRSGVGSTGPLMMRMTCPISGLFAVGAASPMDRALAGTIEMTSRSDFELAGEIDGGSRESLDERGRIGFDAVGGVLSISGRSSS